MRLEYRGNQLVGHRARFIPPTSVPSRMPSRVTTNLFGFTCTSNVISSLQQDSHESSFSLICH